MVGKKSAIVRQDQTAGEKRKLAGGANGRISVGVTLGLVDQPVLNESQAEVGLDPLVMSGFRINRNAPQQSFEIGDPRECGESTLERGAGRFVALLGQGLQIREIDNLAIDAPTVVVTKVPAIEKQVARPSPLLEDLVSCDDEEVDVGVVSRIPFGNGATDDQPDKAWVIAIGVGQSIYGSSVMVSNVHACSISATYTNSQRLQSVIRCADSSSA